MEAAQAKSGSTSEEVQIATEVTSGAGRAKTSRKPRSKTDVAIKLLRQNRGSTLQALENATGWQAHSVRGFLSGTIRKKLGLNLVREQGKDGQSRYRIVDAARDA